MTERKIWGDEERVNRHIENFPAYMGSNISFFLFEYKKGMISKKELRKKINSTVKNLIPALIAEINYWKEKNGIK